MVAKADFFEIFLAALLAVAATAAAQENVSSTERPESLTAPIGEAVTPSLEKWQVDIGEEKGTIEKTMEQTYGLAPLLKNEKQKLHASLEKFLSEKNEENRAALMQAAVSSLITVGNHLSSVVDKREEALLSISKINTKARSIIDRCQQKNEKLKADIKTLELKLNEETDSSKSLKQRYRQEKEPEKLLSLRRELMRKFIAERKLASQMAALKRRSLLYESSVERFKVAARGSQQASMRLELLFADLEIFRTDCITNADIVKDMIELDIVARAFDGRTLGALFADLGEIGATLRDLDKAFSESLGAFAASGEALPMIEDSLGKAFEEWLQAD